MELNDKLVQVKMYNPHDHIFIYERDDGTYYGILIKKGEEDKIVQVNLTIFKHNVKISKSRG